MVESREVVIDRESNLEHRRETTMIKGNPAKRQRSVSPLALTMACSSSTSEELASSIVVAGCDNISSSSSGVGIEEEEDMANCLILLARGERVKPAPSPSNRGNSGCVSANGNGGGNKAGGRRLDSYQCKTCSRCFPSFQALGGHRASHKRPRLLMNEHGSEKKTSCVMIGPPVLGSHHIKADNKSSFTALSLQIPTVTTAPASQISAGKPKAHDCLICGAKFNSGQALGGHMRRHRTVVAAPPITSIAMDLSTSSSNISFDDHPARKNSGKHLDLDLNLPAPLEDHIGSSSLNTAVIV